MRGDLGLQVVERRLDDAHQLPETVGSGPDHRPQRVRTALPGIRGAEAVPDPFRGHRGPAAEGVGEPGQDRSRRRGALEAGPVGEGGNAAEQQARGRRGNLQGAVLRLDRAAAEIDGRRDDPIRSEVVDAGDGAHDVHQRVEGAQFVKMHGLGGHPVDLRLRFEDAPQQQRRPVPDLPSEPAPVQHGEEIAQVAVAAVVRRLDAGLDPAESAARVLCERNRHGRAQRGDRPGKDLGRHSHVHERAEQHVPRDTGGQVEVEDAQGARRILEARRPVRVPRDSGADSLGNAVRPVAGPE